MLVLAMLRLRMQEHVALLALGDRTARMLMKAAAIAAKATPASDLDEIDRQLWEIDENLMRAELNPTELGEHITRREKLWAERKIQVAKVEPPEKSAGYKKPPKQKKGFAADTAEKTGMSKREINRAKSRTEKIPEDVRDTIKGTNLDTGTYLDWLKGMDPDDQRGAVRRCIYSWSIG